MVDSELLEAVQAALEQRDVKEWVLLCIHRGATVTYIGCHSMEVAQRLLAAGMLEVKVLRRKPWPMER